MNDEFPRYYYDYIQGCLLRQPDADTLIYYYIEYQVLNHPRGKDQNAWEITVHRHQGYPIEKLLRAKMRLEQQRFERLLSQCQIKSPTLDDPLPSWFSWPSRSR